MARSASVTGLPLSFCQRLKVPPKNRLAMCPASRTASSSSVRSSTRSASRAGNGHAFYANGGRVGGVAEDEIVCRRQLHEHFFQIARNRHFRHRKGDLSVLDPETGRTAAVVAGHATHAH